MPTNPFLQTQPPSVSLEPQPIVPSEDIVAEVARAHANLSPQAKEAVDRAHGILQAQPQAPAPQQPAPTLIRPGASGPMPTLRLGQPEITEQPPQIPTPETPTLPGLTPPTGRVGPRIPFRSTLSLPNAQSPSIPTVSDEPPQVSGPESPALLSGGPDAMSALRRSLNVAPPPPTANEAKLQHDRTTGSGISQIKNHFGRVLLTAADAIGTGLFPRIAAVIPGTAAHHQVVLANDEGAVKDEQTQQQGRQAQELHDAQVANLQSEPALHDAQVNEANARAEESRAVAKKSGETPVVTKEWQEITGGAVDPEHPELGTQPAFYNKNNPKEGIVFGNAKAGVKPPVAKEGDEPLGEKADAINKAMEARYQVLHPKVPLPDHYLLTPQSTQKDFDRTEKLLNGEENAFGTDQNRKQTDELRKQTAELSKNNKQDKTDQDMRTAVIKDYQPASDSAERFNVMAKNYEDAIKNHDQQAMLSLLSNHIGMTMGLQKGARINQHMYDEAAQSTPWLKALGAKFDKDGYLSGVTLNPDQMRQMVALGRERFSEDISKARSQAKYRGAQDDGPARTPNNSTVNFYTALAGGDPKEAKRLANADGWSIE